MVEDTTNQFDLCKDLAQLIDDFESLGIFLIKDCTQGVSKNISNFYLNSEQFRRLKREYFIKYN